MDTTQKHFHLSIVIPAKNEEESITELSQHIQKEMIEANLTYEVLLIDDGSEDDTWEEIMKIHRQYSMFKGIQLNKNYGKAAALQTGFNHAKGDVIITLDADLQDNPKEIMILYHMMIEGNYHLISGWKKKRKDPFSKTFPSLLFNFITCKMSGIRLHDFNCGIKAYQSIVAKSITLYGEMHRYIPLLVKWQGFKRIGEKVVEHSPRKYGTTKYGRERFIRGFLDLLSIMFIAKFTRKPMHFFGSMGIASLLIGFISTSVLFYQKINALFFSKTTIERAITDQPIFYIALVAIVIGVQLFLTGYLAEMIAMQTFSKRDYIIANTIGI